MRTTTAGGRTWHFSHAVGRNAAAGNGFTQPVDLATAPGGVIYVVNRGGENVDGTVQENKRLNKVTIDHELIGDFARNHFTWATGIAVTSDETIYCSDEYDNIIRIYNSDGEKIAEWGESGSGDGQFQGPSGLVFDREDNVYIVDSRNDRVQKYTKDGQFLFSWGESGSAEGQFNRPYGITLDYDQNVYVVDWGNDRIQKFTAEGDFLKSFGSSSAERGTDLDHPAGVAVDSDGDVYVTDWGNKRVKIFDPEGDVLTCLYGDATELSKWAKEVVESNPDVVKAFNRMKDLSPLGKFERPVGIEIDDQDRIIITETTRGRLQVYTKEKDYLEPQFNL